MNNENPKRADEQRTQELALDEVLAAIKRDETSVNKATRFEADEDFVTDRLRAEFVAQVYTAMKKRNVKTPAALAKLTGVSRPRIGAILQEKGNISLRTIAKIAIALDTPVNLQFGENPKVPAFSAKSEAKDMQLLLMQHNSQRAACADSWTKMENLSTSISTSKRAQRNLSHPDREPMGQGC